MTLSLRAARRRTSPPLFVCVPLLVLGQSSKVPMVSTVLVCSNLSSSFHDDQRIFFSVALKADDIQALKTKFGFQPGEKFVVPKETHDTYAAIASRGASLESEWTSLLSSY